MISFLVLRRDLVRALQKKIRDITLKTLNLHQDKASPKLLYQPSSIDLLGFSHPPYSPDLDPCQSNGDVSPYVVWVAEWPPFGKIATHSVDRMFSLYFDYL